MESAWKRDGISVWASPHKSILKRLYKEKIRLLRAKDCSPVDLLPFLSQFRTLPERLVSFPLPRMKPAEIKKWCFFRYKSLFPLPAAFALTNSCMLHGYLQSVLCPLKVDSCVKFSPQMPDTVTFGGGLRIVSEQSMTEFIKQIIELAHQCHKELRTAMNLKDDFILLTTESFL